MSAGARPPPGEDLPPVQILTLDELARRLYELARECGFESVTLRLGKTWNSCYAGHHNGRGVQVAQAATVEKLVPKAIRVLEDWLEDPPPAPPVVDLKLIEAVRQISDGDIEQVEDLISAWQLGKTLRRLRELVGCPYLGHEDTEEDSDA